MKHLFLPLPIETVRSAWESWRESNLDAGEDVRLLETAGGCFLLTSTSRPPRVFVELLKDFLSEKTAPLASVR